MEKLHQRQLFHGGRTLLWKLVKKIGFRFCKDDPRRGIMELPHIALKRVHFLHQYMELKNTGKHQFIFLDETWVFQDDTVGRSWQDSSVQSVKKKLEGHGNCNYTWMLL